MKVGFIGVGNMGGAILLGLKDKLSQGSAVYYYDINKRKVDEIKSTCGDMIACASEEEVMVNADYVIMSVKPVYYKELFAKVKAHLRSEHVIITIAPGFTTAMTKACLGESAKVVRVMPNVPALVGAGVSVVSYSEDIYADEETKAVNTIFSGVGRVYDLPERLQDAVVPISGSSPAYIFMVIEAMADGGVSMGLPRELAYDLAAGTVLGSAKMVLEGEQHPAQLKDMVCSPGGTTIEAVASLEKNGMRGIFIEAMKECYDKIQRMN